eukprot:3538772-Prymnesium_polylepis.1
MYSGCFCASRLSWASALQAPPWASASLGKRLPTPATLGPCRPSPTATLRAGILARSHGCSSPL